MIVEWDETYLLEWDDVLLVVFLFVNDYVAVDEEVVEKEELPRFQLFSTRLGQNALAHQDTPRHRKRLTGAPKAALDESDPSCVSLTVH